MGQKTSRSSGRLCPFRSGCELESSVYGLRARVPSECPNNPSSQSLRILLSTAAQEAPLPCMVSTLLPFSPE